MEGRRVRVSVQKELNFEYKSGSFLFEHFDGIEVYDTGTLEEKDNEVKGG